MEIKNCQGQSCVVIDDNQVPNIAIFTNTDNTGIGPYDCISSDIDYVMDYYTTVESLKGVLKIADQDLIEGYRGGDELSIPYDNLYILCSKRYAYVNDRGVTPVFKSSKEAFVFKIKNLNSIVEETGIEDWEIITLGSIASDPSQVTINNTTYRFPSTITTNGAGNITISGNASDTFNNLISAINASNNTSV